MTVVDEITQSRKYDKLELVEFAEFVGRVADAKYKETLEYDLSQKIEFVLDDIFTVVNHTRNERDFVAEEQSNSDSDYWERLNLV